MKLLLALSITLFLCFDSSAQTEFVIEPSQSMVMTGKGPGQDATINPYYGQDCYALVENIGKRAFSIRIQQGTGIVEEISIAKDELVKVKLLKGYSLFLDPNPEGVARALVDYEKMED
ncbi:hypothetical protein HZ996_11630 [Cryomorphaceae bacterium]|nr:hypothetical protein HZ996_11630 [Cryomorphaceae bacterium]